MIKRYFRRVKRIVRERVKITRAFFQRPDSLKTSSEICFPLCFRINWTTFGILLIISSHFCFVNHCFQFFRIKSAIFFFPRKVNLSTSSRVFRWILSAAHKSDSFPACLSKGNIWDSQVNFFFKWGNTKKTKIKRS